MNRLSCIVALLLLADSWAQVNVQRIPCDSTESEEAALVAVDYLNGQHAHGYKYMLNRIEDVKIFPRPDGNSTYVLEIDLLETDCHVLDPTPLANCTVRPKILTAVEGDCDVVLDKVAGVLTVTAFKCKTEESTEDMCLGCQTLLPLNHTVALDFVHASLATFNNNTRNLMFTLLEVGRMTAQTVSGGPMYFAEYVVVEANCTDDHCMALNDTTAARGFCTAKGSSVDHTVDCKMFPTLMPDLDTNGTAALLPPPAVNVHLRSVSHKHGLRHHKLTQFHNPHMSGLLSAESAESAEAIPVTPAVTVVSTVLGTSASAVGDSDSAMETSASDEVPLLVVKRDVAVAAAQTEPISLVQLCPGRIRFF